MKMVEKRVLMERIVYDADNEEEEKKARERIYELGDKILDIVPQIVPLTIENKLRFMVFMFIFYKKE
jgi:hypothetical protein